MTILLFIIILAVLILSHEFGHFIIAKKSGIRVEEFGLGFPPRLFGIKKGETLYSFNLIPFGGFVKITGEDDTESHDSGSFGSKPFYLKAAVLVAGVAFNLLFAYFLFVVIIVAGIPTALGDETPANARDIKILIEFVAPGSPAEQAGIQTRDIIQKLQAETDEIAISSESDIYTFTENHPGEIIRMTIARSGETITLPVTSRLSPGPGEGRIGIVPVRVGIISHPLPQAFWEAAKIVWSTTILTLNVFGTLLGKIFAGNNVAGEVAGPIGIAVIVGQSLDLGFIYLLQLTAFISINLAIINIMPFPALDGGRLLFLIIELIIRRPLPKRFTQYANTIAFFLLLSLIILISISDVKKLF